MAKLIKKAAKVVAKKAAEVKVKAVTAASIVLGLLAMKNVPCDADIIAAVHEGVEETKFDKTQLAWYKYQFRQGRWNEGEPQVINQAKAVKAEKPAPKAAKKAVKKVAKKVAVPAETSDEQEETEE